MKASPLSIEIRCDLGITIEALKCVAGAMQAMASNNNLELDIELKALAALREIQAMTRRARLDLGIAERGYSTIRFEFGAVEPKVDAVVPRSTKKRTLH